MSAKGKEEGRPVLCPVILQKLCTRGIELQQPPETSSSQEDLTLLLLIFFGLASVAPKSPICSLMRPSKCYPPPRYDLQVYPWDRWSDESYFRICSYSAITCDSFIGSLFQCYRKILILQCAVLAREERNIVRGNILSRIPCPIVDHLWVVRWQNKNRY